jgi:hypothetical protein
LKTFVDKIYYDLISAIMIQITKGDAIKKKFVTLEKSLVITDATVTMVARIEIKSTTHPSLEAGIKKPL